MKKYQHSFYQLSTYHCKQRQMQKKIFEIAGHRPLLSSAMAFDHQWDIRARKKYANYPYLIS